MPVKSYNVGQPPANVQFEQPQGPFVVGDPDADLSKSTGLHERNPGDEVVDTDMHDQTPTGAFEQPGPEVVELEGWKQSAGQGDDDESVDEGSVQTKVVAPPAASVPESTSGTETK